MRTYGLQLQTEVLAVNLIKFKHISVHAVMSVLMLVSMCMQACVNVERGLVLFVLGACWYCFPT